MNYEQDSKDYFSKQAETYDNNHIGKMTQKYKELLVGIIGTTRNMKTGVSALDVACGTGTLLKMLGEKYSIDGYGIDISQSLTPD